MNREIDIELVRDQIDAEVRRKRASGELPEALERELDGEFGRASATSAQPVGTDRNRDLVRLLKRVKRAAGKAIRRLTGFRKPR